MEAISRTIIGWVGRFEELDGVVKEMFYIARDVRKNAQAPYSHYLVGVAGQSAKTGKVYRGCNVERGSWTQTTHAEQAMLDSMIAAEGKGVKLSKLVLLAGPENQDIVLPPVLPYRRESWQIKFSQIPAPCGHCLQCIWENCLEDGKVGMYGLLPTGEATMVTIDDAFPLKFGPADLGVKY
ncbi:MAG: hypothetical protein HY505_02565 [Candidatus Yanofskybacteria bacterium]|nr:hypothetical protein [Candidatus Yanofskybacteria bacterium]